ncbi:hypothetical protein COEREDRAFT_8225 [Coemansia reversa NRRL 1564]|uniref:Zincin n=1 Tax=Coemansia reversa (strain ATCC 12441 / NRRL 1564) TaxID=763665 RepID=A0A2G5BCK4_COERN|nr:hypothetical protein COEREDRAFT_8225 [Coemansia reversa NRRL 1564]|eukprot:PIA16754.1 hypothetical protein COEREDRAFT_8225 [Coemansia reversa NRRL 1564]
MVLVLNQQRLVWLPLRSIKRQIEILLECSGYAGWDVGVHFIDNQRIQNLNRQYRMKDSATDILSFPFHETVSPESFRRHATTEDDRNLGDMFLAMPYIMHHCKANGESLAGHLPVLLTHGLCHLMGYDHEHDADYLRMISREKEILHKLRTRSFAFPF